MNIWLKEKNRILSDPHDKACIISRPDPAVTYWKQTIFDTCPRLQPPAVSDDDIEPGINEQFE